MQITIPDILSTLHDTSVTPGGGVCTGVKQSDVPRALEKVCVHVGGGVKWLVVGWMWGVWEGGVGRGVGGIRWHVTYLIAVVVD